MKHPAIGGESELKKQEGCNDPKGEETDPTVV